MTDVAIEDAVDVYVQRKAVGDPDGSGAGAYAANAESILRRFADWLDSEHGVTAIADLEPAHMRAYAADLAERTDRGEYTASTAGTYYAVVRAFLSWCVRGGIVPENPAATDRAESALPTPDPAGDDDSWSRDERQHLEAYVRERAEDAADLDREARLARLREYALVAVLAHSGARGAELFRAPEDDRRTGATWDDVDFYAGTIRVLGKSGRLEEATLLARARTPLRRYRVVLDPPSNDWPLFPTRHAPSIARRVREVLRERGLDDAAVEALFEDRTAIELARERAIPPPAITTEGARSVLRRLCSEAGVEVEAEALTPRDVSAASGLERDRREATPPSPALRTTVDERAIAVLERRPAVREAEDGHDSPAESSDDSP